MISINIPSSLCQLLSLEKGFPNTGYVKSVTFAPHTSTNLLPLHIETTHITKELCSFNTTSAFPANIFS